MTAAAKGMEDSIIKTLGEVGELSLPALCSTTKGPIGGLLESASGMRTAPDIVSIIDSRYVSCVVILFLFISLSFPVCIKFW